MAPNVGHEESKKEIRKSCKINCIIVGDMNPLDLFNGQIPHRRIYLQPPTSRRNISKDMKNLDKYLKERSALEENKSQLKK